MIDREKVISDIEKALAAAKTVDSGFVFITVGEAKTALELIKSMEADADIMERCRSGKNVKFVGRGVVVLNYDWWLKMCEKEGWKPVPDAEDLNEAHWVYSEDETGFDGYICSECGFFEPWFYDFDDINFIKKYAYCPACGRKVKFDADP